MLSGLNKVHNRVVSFMSGCRLVEKYLVVTYTEEEFGDTITYDCIYCSILRSLVLGALVGAALTTGVFFVWQA